MSDKMEIRLPYQILRQPDDTTCGPTCLHSMYRFFGVDVPLDQIIQEVGSLREGGTLAVVLGCHALRLGFDATLYTCDLQAFDPTWFRPVSPPLQQRLLAQKQAKTSTKLHLAIDAYVDFLNLGGEIRMEVLNAALVRKFLKKDIPILTGLSATWLYGEPRERFVEGEPHGRSVPDDVAGFPQGHFVVLCDYDPEQRQVLLADPLTPNPLAGDHLYHVSLDRVICAILLGVLTYDANLLIIQPKKARLKTSEPPA